MGRACAVAFGREGAATVHLVARSKADLENVSESIEDTYSTTVKINPIDMIDKASSDDLFSKTQNIDILINNAGAIPSVLFTQYRKKCGGKVGNLKSLVV